VHFSTRWTHRARDAPDAAEGPHTFNDQATLRKPDVAAESDNLHEAATLRTPDAAEGPHSLNEQALCKPDGAEGPGKPYETFTPNVEGSDSFTEAVKLCKLDVAAGSDKPYKAVTLVKPSVNSFKEVTTLRKPELELGPHDLYEAVTLCNPEGSRPHILNEVATSFELDLDMPDSLFEVTVHVSCVSAYLSCRSVPNQVLFLRVVAIANEVAHRAIHLPVRSHMEANGRERFQRLHPG
jgi:hypothetical protein